MPSNSKTVVISQSMYFPWCGLLEQMRLADVFVHYNDVQFARGFYNRVQVKTPQGTAMITVPLKSRHRGQRIDTLSISYDSDWVSHHRSVLLSSYCKTQFLDDAISLFDSVHANQFEKLSDLGRASINALASYLELDRDVLFIDSVDLDVPGASSQRLLDITRALGGRIYLTGHGALNYLDHDIFEQNDVEVRYMNYSLRDYPQVFGAYTPYVTGLDAVAHLGPGAKNIFQSTTINWREANERSEELRA